MLKRTKGLLLLSLLVITGMAGTVDTGTISKKERKTALALLKESRADLFRDVRGLSEAQLNFKPAADRWSVKECVYHIAISEKNLWDFIQKSMNEPANPEKRSEIKVTDEQLVKMMENRDYKVKTAEPFEPKNTPYKSLEDALNDFRERRADHIRYVRSTTEDLRNHVLQMPFGYLDCYQACLMLGAHANRHIQQLNEVKADPNFPKQ
ncbi:MAG TPA: DinB family protein [Chitinophagaceae bacterium]|nr:DinB family protein [Chitinophagaceae bacterium]